MAGAAISCPEAAGVPAQDLGRGRGDGSTLKEKRDFTLEAVIEEQNGK